MQHALRATLVFIGHLPLPILRLLGYLLGMLLVLLPNRFKAITALHVQKCLTEHSSAAHRELIAASLIASAQAVLEVPAIWYGPLKRRSRWIASSPDPLQIIKEAHKQRRGVILLTPHQGAWELASFFCAQVAPLTVLYKPQKGASDAVIKDGRARGAPVTPVPTTGAGVKALLAALKAGNMVGILPDHDPPSESATVFAPLFGIPANTMDLVTKLAARTSAPVLYVVAERMPWAQGFRFHVLSAEPSISDPEQGPAALNRGLERCIRMLPGQYWWSYRRYRRRPPGEPSLYDAPALDRD